MMRWRQARRPDGQPTAVVTRLRKRSGVAPPPPHAFERRVHFHEALMLGDPFLRLRLGLEAAHSGRMGAGYADFNTKGSIFQRNGAIACPSVCVRYGHGILYGPSGAHRKPGNDGPKFHTHRPAMADLGAVRRSNRGAGLFLPANGRIYRRQRRAGAVASSCGINGGCTKWRTRLLWSMTTATS